MTVHHRGKPQLELKLGIWMQALKQERTYWLASPGFLSYVSYTAQAQSSRDRTA